MKKFKLVVKIRLQEFVGLDLSLACKARRG